MILDILHATRVGFDTKTILAASMPVPFLETASVLLQPGAEEGRYVSFLFRYTLFCGYCLIFSKISKYELCSLGLSKLGLEPRHAVRVVGRLCLFTFFYYFFSFASVRGTKFFRLHFIGR